MTQYVREMCQESGQLGDKIISQMLKRPQVTQRFFAIGIHNTLNCSLYCRWLHGWLRVKNWTSPNEVMRTKYFQQIQYTPIHVNVVTRGMLRSYGVKILESLKVFDFDKVLGYEMCAELRLNLERYKVRHRHVYHSIKALHEMIMNLSSDSCEYGPITTLKTLDLAGAEDTTKKDPYVDIIIVNIVIIPRM